MLEVVEVEALAVEADGAGVGAAVGRGEDDAGDAFEEFGFVFADVLGEAGGDAGDEFEGDFYRGWR